MMSCGPELVQFSSFHEELKKLPCISNQDLMPFAAHSGSVPVIEQVPLSQIVFAPFTDSWDLIDRGEDYIFTIAKDINPDNFKLEPKSLLNYFGLYGIGNDGRHRIAALKLMYPDASISVPVQSMDKIENITIVNPEDANILLERLQKGFWRGNLEEHESFGPSGAYFTGIVRQFDGPWVFSRDMSHAKELFMSIRPDLYSTP